MLPYIGILMGFADRQVPVLLVNGVSLAASFFQVVGGLPPPPSRPGLDDFHKLVIGFSLPHQFHDFSGIGKSMDDGDLHDSTVQIQGRLPDALKAADCLEFQSLIQGSSCHDLINAPESRLHDTAGDTEDLCRAASQAKWHVRNSTTSSRSSKLMPAVRIIFASSMTVITISTSPFISGRLHSNFFAVHGITETLQMSSRFRPSFWAK